MKRQFLKWSPAFLFCAFCSVCFLINCIRPDRAMSERENRTLAQRPTFTWEALLSGTFIADTETYISDQFFARDAWISLKAAAEQALLKTDVNGVLLGRDGLLVQPLEEPDPERVRANAGFIEKLAAGTDLPVTLAIIPSVAAIWPERLPANAQTADQQALINTIYALTPSAAHVDVLSALAAHAEEPIYFQTDHHWNTLGAYYGYAAIGTTLGITPQSLPDPYLTRSGFYGTAASACGIRPGSGDTIELRVPEEQAASVTVYEGGDGVESTLYDLSALDKADKYTVFLGGNSPRVVIRSANASGDRLLYLKDSYANACVPYFTSSFSEIHLIDLRYYKKSIADYLRDNQINQVLVSYSLANFVTDSNLMFAAR